MEPATSSVQYRLAVASCRGLVLVHPGISVVAAALFTGFLVYDFNRLANTAMASAGDVIMLAVAIYLDIFNLFLNVLTILQEVSGNSRD
jgi:FtsH-binding integral membrane protein